MLNAVGKPQNILLLGGSSEIGNAIVKEFLARGAAHVTLAMQPGDDRAESSKQDLLDAGASSVEVIDFDATKFDTHREVIDLAFANGDVDVAIIAFGILGDNEEQWTNQEKAVLACNINFTGAVSCGTLLAEKFKAQGHGSIVVMSSAAGMRVRRSNFVYGATKAGVDGFFFNLHEALRGTGAHVLVVRPGQVRTRMSAHVKEAPLTVDKEDVAKAVVDGVMTKKQVIWCPPAFQLVMTALQHIPQFIFRKLPI